jgi:two-component sensor histidine kinase
MTVASETRRELERRLERLTDELRRSTDRYRTLLAERERAEEGLSVDAKRLSGQAEAFRAAVDGASLEHSLGILARLVREETAGAARTAFYVADRDVAQLHPVVRAGDMPDSYTAQVDGFLIGLDSLACGLATATGHPVLTRDVLDEPLWEPWARLAREYDVRGCWSFPIETRDRRPIGTLALYFREPREPGPQELSLAAMVTQAAAIIISRHTEAEERARAERALRASEERHRSLFGSMDEGFVLCEVTGGAGGRPVDIRCVDANPAAVRMIGVELVGRTMHELDLDVGRRWAEVFARVARTGVGERHELAIQRLDAVYTAYVFRSAGRVAAIYQDVTERVRAEERLMLLVRELSHRVKNTLATVQSVASQTLRGSPDPARFVETFQARLQALSRAHTVLTRRSWDSADIADIVREHLELDGGDERFSIEGPGALLTPDSGVALALVLHELGTNARKYGSLSTAAGRVRVAWTRSGAEPAIELCWTESGGPAVAVPARRGFGVTLIEKSLRGVGGSARLCFEPAGLRCTIRLPLVRSARTRPGG